ncbi:hypothetical protein RchiOBHm_Chr2g0165471 [Rosa chinensis]|uniref:Uncharacterized protein n=1 Tax=Rosa chinensis TaxID=74649 RepID=A0A2P6S3U9_ROSCH|nr:hypothetical protein RchiOBHm_Chr2g0165471 [Rosa chinensis]
MLILCSAQIKIPNSVNSQHHIERHRFALRCSLAETIIAEIGKWVIWEERCGVIRNSKFVALLGYHHFRDMQGILQELSLSFD